MSGKLAWKPWHQIVQLRDDLKSGELSLSIFAADLYDVMIGEARPVYQNPYEFFALTYPTFNLRELARDVVLRLAGQNDKAIRLLELTYGGGKTHTLITLYHLTHDPRHLSNLPSVEEFTQHIGQIPPQARTAILAFDKLDVEKGMDVRSPDGTRRRLKYPWSVLAYQLAGSKGLRILHPNDLDEERETAPAEPLLVQLLSLPAKQSLATLILIDEVLMYVREKVGQDERWRGTLINFFQYLTQAAAKVDTCAIVASLLASDPLKSDILGKELMNEVAAIFRRQREEAIQPVEKEDVAEVLRRRFFDPESLKKRDTFRKHVAPIVQGIAALDEQTRKDMRKAEERFVQSYPFHPELTEVLYSKWTQLEGFQRTRGVLRTFAIALRDAEKWDDCPLISTNVFLGTPANAALSESARELTNVAETEEYEGKKQQWAALLEGELAKAREIQIEYPALRFREMEQAVFATFLHSQPIGQKAQTSELLTLLGPTRPDRIELEKALRRWAEVSWFLDEGAFQDTKSGQVIVRSLPGYWRLGIKPNLKQMHHDACTRVPAEIIEERLEELIRTSKSLISGASAAGAHVHILPERPRDIEDDGEFHYVILGPASSSRPNQPSIEVKRFLNEKTGPDTPRVYRNAVVIATPLVEGLAGLREAIRRHQGWLDVENRLTEQELDNTRKQLLVVEAKNELVRINELVKQIYCVIVTVSDKNEIEAFKVVVGDDPLFTAIKKNPQARILETAVEASALLPDGPYDLWRDGDTEHRVSDLEYAFAQFSRLPKMLKRKAILETLLDGCRQGLFVLRSDRPGETYRTYWYDAPDTAIAKDLNLSVVLSEYAMLSILPSHLLSPNKLPGLWQEEELSVWDLYRYFSGRTVFIQYDGFEEPRTIPKANHAVIHQAIQEAVKTKLLWFTSGQTSLFAEDIPTDVITEEAILQAPPQPIAAKEIIPDNLPEAWNGNIETTALAIVNALSTKFGKVLPWVIVRDTISAAFAARFVERAPDSGPWPCDYAGSSSVKICQRVDKTQQTKSSGPTVSDGSSEYEARVTTKTGLFVTEAELRTDQLQNLYEQLGEIGRICSDVAGSEPKFHLRIELQPRSQLTSDGIERINHVLQEVSDQLKIQEQ